MARDGDKNTSQDKRRGNDGSSGTRGWDTGKTASSKPQDKSPAKPGVPAATSLRPSAPAWGPSAKQQTPLPSSIPGSGMQILKTTSTGTPSKPSPRAVTTTPSTGGGTSSWAALLGGGGGGSSSEKTTPKAATSPQNKPVVHQSPRSTTYSSPVSPRSFSFQRGNGVVLVHEAPLSPKSPQSPAKINISNNEQQQNSGGNTISTVTPSPTLSWAEKAKLAAAQAPQGVAPLLQKTAPAPQGGKRNAKAAAQVTSPKRGQGAPRSPGGVDSRHNNNNNRGNQARSSPPVDGHHRHHHQQHEKTKGASHQDQRDSHSTKKSVVEIDAPQLLSVVSEPEPPIVMQKEEINSGNDVVVAEHEKATSSPSADIKEALDILCSSLASWKLPQNNKNQTTSSLQQQRVQPRGIKNPGNLCFVNAVLQGLMGTSSFCHILLALRSLAHSSDEILDAKTFPVLSAMVNVAAEFSQKPPENVIVVDKKAINSTNDATKAKNANLVTVLGGHPVSSALIMDIINQFAPRQQQQQVQPLQLIGSSSKGGGEAQVEQEDAHEFLHFLLDKMDSELFALRKAVKKSTAEEETPAPEQRGGGGGGELDSFEDDDGWLVKSGKKAVRQQEVSAVGHSNEAASIITSLFQGKFATSVACAGAPNSVTVHPFMIVELPIYSDSIRSISDSLDALTAAEVLEDYKPATGAIPQQAAKTEKILHLPDVLVLHLMRFQYTGKSAKISKYVSFEPRLAMKSSWMATGTPDRGAVYNLVATVTHHGKTISRGHYTSDVVQPDGKWLRFDDSDVYWVKKHQVLSDTPYLLVYERQR